MQSHLPPLDTNQKDNNDSANDKSSSDGSHKFYSYPITGIRFQSFINPSLIIGSKEYNHHDPRYNILNIINSFQKHVSRTNAQASCQHRAHQSHVIQQQADIQQAYHQQHIFNATTNPDTVTPQTLYPSITAVKDDRENSPSVLCRICLLAQSTSHRDPSSLPPPDFPNGQVNHITPSPKSISISHNTDKMGSKKVHSDSTGTTSDSHRLEIGSDQSIVAVSHQLSFKSSVDSSHAPSERKPVTFSDRGSFLLKEDNTTESSRKACSSQTDQPGKNLSERSSQSLVEDYSPSVSSDSKPPQIPLVRHGTSPYPMRRNSSNNIDSVSVGPSDQERSGSGHNSLAPSNNTERSFSVNVMTSESSFAPLSQQSSRSVSNRGDDRKTKKKSLPGSFGSLTPSTSKTHSKIYKKHSSNVPSNEGNESHFYESKLPSQPLPEGHPRLSKDIKHTSYDSKASTNTSISSKTSYKVSTSSPSPFRNDNAARYNRQPRVIGSPAGLEPDLGITRSENPPRSQIRLSSSQSSKQKSNDSRMISVSNSTSSYLPTSNDDFHHSPNAPVKDDIKKEKKASSFPPLVAAAIHGKPNDVTQSTILPPYPDNRDERGNETDIAQRTDLASPFLPLEKTKAAYTQPQLPSQLIDRNQVLQLQSPMTFSGTNISHTPPLNDNRFAQKSCPPTLLYSSQDDIFGDQGLKREIYHSSDKDNQFMSTSDTTHTSYRSTTNVYDPNDEKNDQVPSYLSSEHHFSSKRDDKIEDIQSATEKDWRRRTTPLKTRGMIPPSPSHHSHYNQIRPYPAPGILPSPSYSMVYSDSSQSNPGDCELGKNTPSPSPIVVPNNPQCLCHCSCQHIFTMEEMGQDHSDKSDQCCSVHTTKPMVWTSYRYFLYQQMVLLHEALAIYVNKHILSYCDTHCVSSTESGQCFGHFSHPGALFRGILGNSQNTLSLTDNQTFCPATSSVGLTSQFLYQSLTRPLFERYLRSANDFLQRTYAIFVEDGLRKSLDQFPLSLLCRTDTWTRSKASKALKKGAKNRKKRLRNIKIREINQHETRSFSLGSMSANDRSAILHPPYISDLLLDHLIKRNIAPSPTSPSMSAVISFYNESGCIPDSNYDGVSSSIVSSQASVPETLRAKSLEESILEHDSIKFTSSLTPSQLFRTSFPKYSNNNPNLDRSQNTGSTSDPLQWRYKSSSKVAPPMPTGPPPLQEMLSLPLRSTEGESNLLSHVRLLFSEADGSLVRIPLATNQGDPRTPIYQLTTSSEPLPETVDDSWRFGMYLGSPQAPTQGSAPVMKQVVAESSNVATNNRSGEPPLNMIGDSTHQSAVLGIPSCDRVYLQTPSAWVLKRGLSNVDSMTRTTPSAWGIKRSIKEAPIIASIHSLINISRKPPSYQSNDIRTGASTVAPPRQLSLEDLYVLRINDDCAHDASSSTDLGSYSCPSSSYSFPSAQSPSSFLFDYFIDALYSNTQYIIQHTPSIRDILQDISHMKLYYLIAIVKVMMGLPLSHFVDLEKSINHISCIYDDSRCLSEDQSLEKAACRMASRSTSFKHRLYSTILSIESNDELFNAMETTSIKKLCKSPKEALELFRHAWNRSDELTSQYPTSNRADKSDIYHFINIELSHLPSTVQSILIKLTSLNEMVTGASRKNGAILTPFDDLERQLLNEKDTNDLLFDQPAIITPIDRSSSRQQPFPTPPQLHGDHSSQSTGEIRPSTDITTSKCYVMVTSAQKTSLYDLLREIIAIMMETYRTIVFDYQYQMKENHSQISPSHPEPNTTPSAPSLLQNDSNTSSGTKTSYQSSTSSSSSAQDVQFRSCLCLGFQKICSKCSHSPYVFPHLPSCETRRPNSLQGSGISDTQRMFKQLATIIAQKAFKSSLPLFYIRKQDFYSKTRQNRNSVFQIDHSRTNSQSTLSSQSRKIPDSMRAGTCIYFTPSTSLGSHLTLNTIGYMINGYMSCHLKSEDYEHFESHNTPLNDQYGKGKNENTKSGLSSSKMSPRLAPSIIGPKSCSHIDLSSPSADVAYGHYFDTSESSSTNTTSTTSSMLSDERHHNCNSQIVKKKDSKSLPQSPQTYPLGPMYNTIMSRYLSRQDIIRLTSRSSIPDIASDFTSRCYSIIKPRHFTRSPPTQPPLGPYSRLNTGIEESTLEKVPFGLKDSNNFQVFSYPYHISFTTLARQFNKPSSGISQTMLLLSYIFRNKTPKRSVCSTPKTTSSLSYGLSLKEKPLYYNPDINKVDAYELYHNVDDLKHSASIEFLKSLEKNKRDSNIGQEPHQKNETQHTGYEHQHQHHRHTHLQPRNKHQHQHHQHQHQPGQNGLHKNVLSSRFECMLKAIQNHEVPDAPRVNNLLLNHDILFPMYNINVHDIISSLKGLLSFLNMQNIANQAPTSSHARITSPQYFPAIHSLRGTSITKPYPPSTTRKLNPPLLCQIGCTGLKIICTPILMASSISVSRSSLLLPLKMSPAPLDKHKKHLKTLKSEAQESVQSKDETIVDDKATNKSRNQDLDRYDVKLAQKWMEPVVATGDIEAAFSTMQQVLTSQLTYQSHERYEYIIHKWKVREGFNIDTPQRKTIWKPGFYPNHNNIEHLNACDPLGVDAPLGVHINDTFDYLRIPYPDGRLSNSKISQPLENGDHFPISTPTTSNLSKFRMCESGPLSFHKKQPKYSGAGKIPNDPSYLSNLLSNIPKLQLRDGLYHETAVKQIPSSLSIPVTINQRQQLYAMRVDAQNSTALSSISNDPSPSPRTPLLPHQIGNTSATNTPRLNQPSKSHDNERKILSGPSQDFLPAGGFIMTIPSQNARSRLHGSQSRPPRHTRPSSSQSIAKAHLNTKSTYLPTPLPFLRSSPVNPSGGRNELTSRTYRTDLTKNSRQSTPNIQNNNNTKNMAGRPSTGTERGRLNNDIENNLDTPPHPLAKYNQLITHRFDTSLDAINKLSLPFYLDSSKDDPSIESDYRCDWNGQCKIDLNKATSKVNTPHLLCNCCIGWSYLVSLFQVTQDTMVIVLIDNILFIVYGVREVYTDPSVPGSSLYDVVDILLQSKIDQSAEHHQEPLTSTGHDSPVLSLLQESPKQRKDAEPTETTPKDILPMQFVNDSSNVLSSVAAAPLAATNPAVPYPLLSATPYQTFTGPLVPHTVSYPSHSALHAVSDAISIREGRRDIITPGKIAKRHNVFNPTIEPTKRQHSQISSALLSKYAPYSTPGVAPTILLNKQKRGITTSPPHLSPPSLPLIANPTAAEDSNDSYLNQFTSSTTNASTGTPPDQLTSRSPLRHFSTPHKSSYNQRVSSVLEDTTINHRNDSVSAGNTPTIGLRTKKSSDPSIVHHSVNSPLSRDTFINGKREVSPKVIDSFDSPHSSGLKAVGSPHGSKLASVIHLLSRDSTPARSPLSRHTPASKRYNQPHPSLDYNKSIPLESSASPSRRNPTSSSQSSNRILSAISTTGLSLNSQDDVLKPYIHNINRSHWENSAIRPNILPSQTASLNLKSSDSTDKESWANRSIQDEKRFSTFSPADESVTSEDTLVFDTSMSLVETQLKRRHQRYKKHVISQVEDINSIEAIGQTQCKKNDIKTRSHRLLGRGGTSVVSKTYLQGIVPNSSPYDSLHPYKPPSANIRREDLVPPRHESSLLAALAASPAITDKIPSSTDNTSKRYEESHDSLHVTQSDSLSMPSRDQAIHSNGRVSIVSSSSSSSASSSSSGSSSTSLSPPVYRHNMSIPIIPEPNIKKEQLPHNPPQLGVLKALKSRLPDTLSQTSEHQSTSAVESDNDRSSSTPWSIYNTNNIDDNRRHGRAPQAQTMSASIATRTLDTPATLRDHLDRERLEREKYLDPGRESLSDFEDVVLRSKHGDERLDWPISQSALHKTYDNAPLKQDIASTTIPLFSSTTSSEMQAFQSVALKSLQLFNHPSAMHNIYNNVSTESSVPVADPSTNLMSPYPPLAHLAQPLNPQAPAPHRLTPPQNALIPPQTLTQHLSNNKSKQNPMSTTITVPVLSGQAASSIPSTPLATSATVTLSGTISATKSSSSEYPQSVVGPLPSGGVALLPPWPYKLYSEGLSSTSDSTNSLKYPNPQFPSPPQISTPLPTSLPSGFPLSALAFSQSLSSSPSLVNASINQPFSISFPAPPQVNLIPPIFGPLPPMPIDYTGSWYNMLQIQQQNTSLQLIAFQQHQIMHYQRELIKQQDYISRLGIYLSRILLFIQPNLSAHNSNTPPPPPSQSNINNRVPNTIHPHFPVVPEYSNLTQSRHVTTDKQGIPIILPKFLSMSEAGGITPLSVVQQLHSTQKAPTPEQCYTQNILGIPSAGPTTQSSTPFSSINGPRNPTSLSHSNQPQHSSLPPLPLPDQIYRDCTADQVTPASTAQLKNGIPIAIGAKTAGIDDSKESPLLHFPNVDQLRIQNKTGKHFKTSLSQSTEIPPYSSTSLQRAVDKGGRNNVPSQTVSGMYRRKRNSTPLNPLNERKIVDNDSLRRSGAMTTPPMFVSHNVRNDIEDDHDGSYADAEESGSETSDNNSNPTIARRRNRQFAEDEKRLHFENQDVKYEDTTSSSIQIPSQSQTLSLTSNLLSNSTLRSPRIPKFRLKPIYICTISELVETGRLSRCDRVQNAQRVIQLDPTQQENIPENAHAITTCEPSQNYKNESVSVNKSLDDQVLKRQVLISRCGQLPKVWVDWSEIVTKITTQPGSGILAVGISKL